MVEGVIGFFLAAFVSLFTIINPLSTASVFHAIAKGNSEKERKYMAKRATVIAVVVLVFFMFLGDILLDFFNVSIDAFRIASGILVFGVGYGMVRSGKQYFSTEEEKKHAIQKDDVSIVPLAIPMLSGPGAMATALFLMQGTEGKLFNVAMLIIAIVAVCLIAYALLLRAHALDKFFGKTGTKVIDKILGLIVLVMGIQFIITGLGGILKVWFG